MRQSLVRVGWKRGLRAAGWVVPDGDRLLDCLLSRKKLSAVPRDLRDPRLANRFADLLDDPTAIQLRQWWNRVCGLPHDRSLLQDRTILLSFPAGAWDIPWELLVNDEYLGSDLTNQATISLSRISGDIEPASPSVFTEPLRTLVLKGAGGGLNLEKEIQTVQSAWENLELTVKDRVQKPLVRDATRDTLSGILQGHQPHVIWFSGHGSVKKWRKVRLLFADGEWVAARTLAELIKESGHQPLFAVFWACETGRAERVEDRRCAPALYEELRSIGVCSVLAMQSPIRDASALRMAQDLFRHLAMGLPLEKAIARARVQLRENPPRHAHKMDWASPVVWSAGLPPESLRWADESPMPAQFQVLGRYALGWTRARPQQLDAPLTLDEKYRAAVWVQRVRSWIQGDIREAEHQNFWLRTLQAIQSESEQFVIAVELSEDSPAETLRAWAESIVQRMVPGDFPEVMADILFEISQSPNLGKGWDKLCQLPAAYVAIANPPDYHSTAADWFWKPVLTDSANTRFAVLTDQTVSDHALADGWQVDAAPEWEAAQMPRASDYEVLEAATSTAPRLARALAVLNMPLWEYQLTVPVEPQEGAASVAEWSESPSVMIETAAGPVMSASARGYVLSGMGRSEKWQGHSDCVQILGHPDLVLTLPIRERRLDHLMASGFYREAALQEAIILCNSYRAANRPAAVVQLFERLDDLYLPERCLLIVAWAYLQLGRLEEAQDWLPEEGLTEPLDIAWRHYIRSEIYKSAGTLFSGDNALTEIEAAISICQEAAEKDPGNELAKRRARAYRQDRARILHFLFRDPAKAAQEYGRLVYEWRDDPGIDLAIVQRNYAECLRKLASGPTDIQWSKARSLLQEAERWAKQYPHAPVLAEILYERVKFAEAEQRLTDASELLEECQEAARTSHHHMLVAIADNRLFWNREEFSFERWQEIEQALSQFSHHGWAVRTLLNSRLRVARILEKDGNFAGSFAQLKANLTDLNRNPALDRARGDRTRIAETAAGLHMIGKKLGRPTSFWQDFLTLYEWAPAWLQEHSVTSPKDIWREVS